jgi:hypothetical protein
MSDQKPDVPAEYEITFKVPPARGRGRFAVGDATLTSFTLRETNGKDEEYAAERAKAMKTSMTEELIRVSIVAVNGERVAQPYLALGLWNSKARTRLARAFQEINSASDKEDEDFDKADAAPEAGDADAAAE